MLWRDICFLCKQTEKLDELKRPYDVFERREVFCNEKGVKRNEFYQGQAQGYRPELCLEIPSSEYRKESYVEYNGDMYHVIRTYPIKNECIEIICQSMIVVDGA